MTNVDAHARRSDPYTSDQAVKAIAKNGSLMNEIHMAARRWINREQGFNDTELTEAIEWSTRTRQQRNVIARSRGLLVQAGILEPVGVFSYQGQPLMHYRLARPFVPITYNTKEP